MRVACLRDGAVSWVRTFISHSSLRFFHSGDKDCVRRFDIVLEDNASHLINLRRYL